jgi:hypothetical protein
MVFVARPETEWIELEQSKWVKVAGYEFDLSAGFDSPPSKDRLLQRLTRPASRTMAEIMNRL